MAQTDIFNVKDKLPDVRRGSFLVYAPKSFPKNSRWLVAEYKEDVKGFYSESSEIFLDDVTHWCKLPDEPKPMAQQTAVEWFINEIESKGEAWENASIRRVQISIDVSEYLELKRQANQMFEEQIKTAYLKGRADGSDEREGSYTRYLDEIDFFNETYKPV